MKWIVTGASGLLGQHIMHHIPATDDKTGWYYRTPVPSGIRVDVRDEQAVGVAISDDIDVVVHCAAEPNIESCEADPDAAELLNVHATRVVAEACRRHDIRLVHVSTDYVFDGTADEPYDESAERNPLQVYGRTKVLAEDALSGLSDVVIARIPLLYGRLDETAKATWYEQCVSKFENGEPVSVDDTHIRQPAAATDIAHVLVALGRSQETGIVHVAPDEIMTKFAWTQKIADALGFDVSAVAPTYDTSLEVPRPVRPTLATTRLKSFGIAPPRAASVVLRNE